MSLTFTLLKYWEMYRETSGLTIDEIPARSLRIERQFVTSSALCFKMLFQCFNHYNMYVHQVLLLFTLWSNTYHNHVYRRSKNFLIFFWDLSQIKIPKKKVMQFQWYISLRTKILREIWKTLDSYTYYLQQQYFCSDIRMLLAI